MELDTCTAISSDPQTLSFLRADGVPIFLRILKGSGFEHGPFSLGRWYLPVGITALAWVVVSTVRTSNPVSNVLTIMSRWSRGDI